MCYGPMTAANPTANASPPRAPLEPTKHEIVLRGHRVSYRTAGEGDSVVLLIHGIVGCAKQWDPVARILAEHYTVLAPDLLGHGESAKPRGDYSLGAYAASVRDVLVALGHRRATVVGHSLGGGVAMQFAYEYPPFAERLVLVSSGGLGREGHLMLRAAPLPRPPPGPPPFPPQRPPRLCGAGGPGLRPPRPRGRPPPGPKGRRAPAPG